MIPINLKIIDFDNTLFNSPLPPEETGEEWWAEPRSLEDPHVPENPNEQWWNQELLNKIRIMKRNSSNLVILMTGRTDKTFKKRIKYLISTQNLKFDHIFLKDGELTTFKYKMDKINQLLDAYPSITNIEMWEDRENHYFRFRKSFKKIKLPAVVHLETMFKVPEWED